jgi:transcriptional regulator with XRE-family HTH domain
MDTLFTKKERAAIRKTFGDLLRKKRNIRGISQEELAFEELLPRRQEILRSGGGRQVPCRNRIDSSLDPPLKGWDCVELPVQSGLHRTYVGSVERGERNLSLENIFVFAKALQCHPRELIPD